MMRKICNVLLHHFPGLHAFQINSLCFSSPPDTYAVTSGRVVKIKMSYTCDSSTSLASDDMPLIRIVTVSSAKSNICLSKDISVECVTTPPHIFQEKCAAGHRLSCQLFQSPQYIERPNLEFPAKTKHTINFGMDCLSACSI